MRSLPSPIPPSVRPAVAAQRRNDVTDPAVSSRGISNPSLDRKTNEQAPAWAASDLRHADETDFVRSDDRSSCTHPPGIAPQAERAY
ncbi:hypothetical protein VTN96DRAFT_990 [Rasamsonia emersonii]